MTPSGSFSSLTGDDAPSILRNDDSGIAWLTIHRPHVANALSAEAIRRCATNSSRSTTTRRSASS